MSDLINCAIKISKVPYKYDSTRYKIVITFCDEIAERFENNGIDYILAQPIIFSRISGRNNEMKFYGFNSQIEACPPFAKSKGWKKYDKKTHSIRYADVRHINKLECFIGDYSDFDDRKLTDPSCTGYKYELFHICVSKLYYASDIYPDQPSKPLKDASNRIKEKMEAKPQMTAEEINNEARKLLETLVSEQKRVLSYQITKKGKELSKLITQWVTLFPDEVAPTEWYQKNIGQFDILNEMEV